MTQTTYYYPTETKPSIWKSIAAAICYYLLYEAIRFVFEIGYTIYLMFTLPLDGLSPEAMNVMLQEASYRDGNLLMVFLDAVIFLVLAIFFLARGKKFSHAMGMKKTRVESIPLALLAGIALYCVLTFVMGYVEMIFPTVIEEYSESMDVTYNTQQIILYILAGVVGAPLIEELVFRHLFTGRLAQAMPRIAAILIGSAVFGIVHWNLVQSIYAGLLGICLACVYLAYDSIWVSVAMHAGFNGMSLLSLIDVESMTEAQLMTFNMILNLAFMILVLVGIGALVFLFVRKTHPIFHRPKPTAVSTVEAIPLPAPTVAVQWDTLLARPYQAGNFPSVADLSANMVKPEQATQSPETAPADSAGEVEEPLPSTASDGEDLSVSPSDRPDEAASTHSGEEAQ